MIKEAIQTLSDGRALKWPQMEEVMTEIMSEKTSSAQIGAFLMALKMKGEGEEEIIGGAKGVLRKAVLIRTKRIDLVDLCGTGGDGCSTFNISTVSAFVTAGAGVGVAKHGNRSVSSRCGSADLLDALGVDLELSPAKIAAGIDAIGFGFLFAPLFFPAMKHVMQPRKEIGVRTLFNIIGPLSNPLRVKRQLLGVYSRELLMPVCRALKSLGSERALIVHSRDGMDEISISAITHGVLLLNGKISELEINPEDYGFSFRPQEEIKAASIEENVRIFHAVLNGDIGSEREVVLLNAGAAIFISGIARDIREGIEIARESIDSGQALKKFRDYFEFAKRGKDDIFHGKCFVPKEKRREIKKKIPF